MVATEPTNSTSYGESESESEHEPIPDKPADSTSSGDEESESESEPEPTPTSTPIAIKTSKPTDSTSDEESESESEPEPVKTSKPAPSSEESESDSEPEKEPSSKPLSSTPTPTRTPTPTLMPIEPTKSSSEESESESETEPEAVKTSKLAPISSSEESESEPENEPSIKPLSSTPTVTVTTIAIEPTKSSSSEEPETEPEPEKISKLVPVSSSSSEEEEESEKLPVPDPIINQSTGKRPPPAELQDRHAKRVKMGIVIALPSPAAQTAAAGGAEKKQLFQRLYSEENEIELIQGMIDFVEQKCKDPLSDAGQFYEFVKGSLNVDVTHKQLLSKIRKLKLKFRNNAVKVENNGKVRSFANLHEKKMYELSEKIWGNGSKNNVMSSNKLNVPNKKRKTVSFENGSEVVETKFVVSGNKFGVPTEAEMMSIGIEKLSEVDKVAMEEKWKDVKVEEYKIYIKKAELMKEQAQLVLDTITKSGKGAK